MVKLIVHNFGAGTCSLSGKEADGLTVTFEDGTVREGFLSFKSLQQLLRMKAPKKGEPKLAAAPMAAPVNGPAVAAAK